MSDTADAALAIANLKARYCAAADRAAGDPAGASAELHPLFQEDATADYGGGQICGPAAIGDYLATAIAGSSTWMLHLLGSPRIEPAGDVATGDWVVQVAAARRNGDRDTIHGRYADRFRRTAGGWRIAHVGFARIGEA